MTNKEAEHWLISHDFTYVKDGDYWAHRSNRPQVADCMVQDHPVDAVKFIASELGVDVK